MLGIDHQIIYYHLHANPAIKLIVQKKRNFAAERVTVIKAEIDKLLVVGFIE